MTGLVDIGRSDRFRVVIFDADSDPELVLETESPKRAARWSAEWLRDHKGFAVAVLPPRYQSDTTPT